MSELYKKIGESNYDQLLADPQGADVIGIPCEPGNGEIPRGTVMYRKANGLWAPAANDQISTSYMLVILNEDVDTGTTVGSTSVAEDAAAYRAGRFVDGKVMLASKATLSDANKVVLRLQGIVFSPMESTGTFRNDAVTITYVANNEADPAEDDVEIAVPFGTSYTILNNSASALGFTAPSTKSFSKWNTKADGTGTDYAAAASYDAEADLKLYAVWA